MAQVLTAKQVGFASRYVGAIGSLIAALDTLALLKDEWTANAYPSGSSPASANITDTVLQGNGFPYLTALQLNQCVGAVESIRDAAGQNRGYLEALRP